MQLFLLTAQTTDSSNSLTVQAAKQMNAFQRYWASIDWDLILSTIIQKSLYIFFISIFFALLHRVGKMLIRRTRLFYSNRATINENRVSTMRTLLLTVFNYGLGFFYIYSLLSILGVPIGSLLAGAGIAGVAIGLGAQGFMNDMITGFFIIMEQQMDVGDYVRFANLALEGTVTSVGIRSVQLKSADGTVHYIPNRNVTTISNLSRANMQVMVDIRILPDEGYDKIVPIIEEVNKQIKEKYANDLQTEPAVFGLVDLGNSNFAIRTICYVLNGRQAVIKEELLSLYVRALTTAGYSIPNTPILGK